MRLRRLFLPVAAGAALYYAFFGGEYSMLDVHRIEHERRQEASRLDSVKEENALLRARLDSLEHDRASLERLARERYGMVGRDERLYRFADTARDSTR